MGPFQFSVIGINEKIYFLWKNHYNRFGAILFSGKFTSFHSVVIARAVAECDSERIR